MIYLYARVSTAEQAAGSSIEEQIRVARAMANAMHPKGRVFEKDVEIVTDPGISGSIPFHERPGGGWLTDMLLEGDVLIVSKLDRAFRSAEDALMRSRDFEERGVDLVLADMGPQPVTKNGVGRLFFTMMAALAEFERERIAERTADGRIAKKASGGFTGGKAPFGYRVVGHGREARLEEDAVEQLAIPKILAYRRRGMSLRKVSERIREEFGVSISYATVRRVEIDELEKQEKAEAEKKREVA